MNVDFAATTPIAAPLRAPVVWFMSLAAALGTSAIYPLQPAIADVAGSLGSPVTAVGFALACGPAGYLIGLALLVPMVDRFPANRVLAMQFAVLAAALAVNTVVSSVWALGPVIGVIGACSAVGAGLSSVAARLAPPHRRATILGIVTAGISAGILAGRIVGGWLADEIGWRGMILVFAAACAVVAVSCLSLLPATQGGGGRGYLATLRSIPGLVVRYSVLRLAALRGALWFFAFCAVWAGLAVALSEPPFSYSAERIGLYALAGLSGIVATRIAGTWTDRAGARRVILVGLALTGAAAAVIGFALENTAVTLVCLALFDAGLFAAQVANQSTVLAINPAAPSRFNSAYMLVYFVGGSLGTAFGAASVEWFGWPGTALLAAGTVGAAALLTVPEREDANPAAAADNAP
ncbi:MFS transporter [Saccharomonospora xinjiangensis]|uniref:Arabinose efflux permease family protein n=1 Tax=Saccharomonospora xinjiangensis XJ-54 TaxID=882086 RepID=I0V007_9PSEU|nr:MFS transporter [Saccharomonospora xinjiangensis]EID53460.1 arabinose efflux permease family protein [Saccharomonospora xinjiangensis XJ-54]